MKSSKPIDSLILTLRNQKVIIDADLAELYGVPTKVLNQAVKRNADRFPEDFRSQLTVDEWDEFVNRSHIVTASKRNVRHLPYAFTEHGALQAANVLKNERAVAMGVYVIRAFPRLCANARAAHGEFGDPPTAFQDGSQAPRTRRRPRDPLEQTQAAPDSAAASAKAAHRLQTLTSMSVAQP